MGTEIIMNGTLYKAEDTGAFDQYGVDFDVYYDNHSAASAPGKLFMLVETEKKFR